MVKLLLNRWFPAVTVLFISLIFNQLNAQTEESYDLDELDSTEEFTPRVLGFSDEEVLSRFSQLNSCVDLQMTNAVRGYLATYLLRKSDKTRGMLGRRLMYFPLFEQKAEEYGVPKDLKYLSVVESALTPVAISRAKAVGLWQFMPATGSQYGLKQDKVMDERCNPVNATDAAMRYLKSLHAQFGDWALALAAYNSGPGRVSNAMKRAHSNNFWEIQRFLPKETANYVPAFIAATYICNFFALHNLTPDNPDLDMQLTSYLRIWEGLSFNSIAEATGVDYQTIKALNPGYKRDYIPADMDGNYVIVPSRVLPAFTNYLNSLTDQHNYLADVSTLFTNADDGGDARYATVTYRIDKMDNLDHIGRAIGICPDHLRAWNKVESNWISAGTFLKVWKPVGVLKHQTLRIQPPVLAPPPVKKPEPAEAAVPPKFEEKIALKPTVNQPKTAEGKAQAAKAAAAKAAAEKAAADAKKYEWYTLRRNETLDEVAKRFGTTAEDIRKLNGPDFLKIGMRLKVKELE